MAKLKARLDLLFLHVPASISNWGHSFNERVTAGGEVEIEAAFAAFTRFSLAFDLRDPP